MAKQKNKKKKIKIVLPVIIVAAVICVCIPVLAKYIFNNKTETEMKSNDFHISSAYLEESGATYDIVDWGEGFTIPIYNYEKENLALVASEDITYTITLSGGWVYSVNGVTAKSYTLPKSDTRISQEIKITPQASTTGGSVTVTLHTTSPYQKTLTATFNVKDKKVPEYSIAYDSESNHTTISIATNDYSGTMTVKWLSDSQTPDTTNTYMSTWSNSNTTSDGYSYGTLTVEENSTYELDIIGPAAETTGSGTTITLAVPTT